MTKVTSILVKNLRERTGAGIMDCKKALLKTNGDIELAIDNMRQSGQVKVAKKSSRVASEGVIIGGISHDKKFGVLLELNCETDFVSRTADFIEFGNEVLKAVLIKKLSNIGELKLKFEERRAEIISRIDENINISRISVLEGEKIDFYLHGFRIGVLVSSKGADDQLVKCIAMHIASAKPEYLTPEDVPDDIISRERKIQLNIAMQSGKSDKIIEKIVTERMNKFMNEISLMSQAFIMDPKKSVSVLLKERNAKVISFIRFELGERI